MSFGPKLHELPAECYPGEEMIITLDFTPRFTEFERTVELYVEEPTGIRTITLTVKSDPESPNHEVAS